MKAEDFIALGVVAFIVWIALKFFPRQKPEIVFGFTINHIKIEGTKIMVSLTSTQQVTGQLTPTNRLGAPAPVEPGTVLVESSDTSVVAVERDPDDQTKFKLIAKSAGVATINVVADADLGEGVAPISGTVNVEVVAAQATGFGLAFGEAEEQPAV